MKFRSFYIALLLVTAVPGSSVSFGLDIGTPLRLVVMPSGTWKQGTATVMEIAPDSSWIKISASEHVPTLVDSLVNKIWLRVDGWVHGSDTWDISPQTILVDRQSGSFIAYAFRKGKKLTPIFLSDGMFRLYLKNYPEANYRVTNEGLPEVFPITMKVFRNHEVVELSFDLVNYGWLELGTSDGEPIVLKCLFAHRSNTIDGDSGATIPNVKFWYDFDRDLNIWPIPIWYSVDLVYYGESKNVAVFGIRE